MHTHYLQSKNKATKLANCIAEDIDARISSLQREVDGDDAATPTPATKMFRSSTDVN